MLSSDETRAGGKPNQRKGKPAQMNKKGEQRNRKAAAPVPDVEQPQSAPEPIEAETPVAAMETAAPLSSADASPIVPATAEESVPVGYRAFAEAWSNYSRTSLEQAKAYFEKLAGARTPGAAFEVQAGFAKQACETFVAQSQRIGELQGELAKQRLKRLEGFVEKMTLGGTRRS